MKKFLLMMIGVLMSLPTFARDFTYEYEGQTLTFTVLDEGAKTCETRAGSVDYDSNTMSVGNRTEVKNLVVPALAKDSEKNVEYTVVKIGDCGFGFNSFESVTIPKTVKEIGDYAFYACPTITSITIPVGISEIGSYAFCNSSSLTSITIPEGVTGM